MCDCVHHGREGVGGKDRGSDDVVRVFIQFFRIFKNKPYKPLFDAQATWVAPGLRKWPVGPFKAV